MSAQRLDLRVERDGDRVRLSSPSVGTLTCAAPTGRALVAGDVAGVLTTLGREFELCVPEGVAGIVENTPPEAVHAPVGFGTVLYVLGALHAGRATNPADAKTSAEGSLTFRSPSAGRFWHRSAPNEPALVREGDEVEIGRAIGLIEVMKTFTLVHYQTRGGLPARARIVRVLAADGAEVAEKTALFELEAI